MHFASQQRRLRGAFTLSVNSLSAEEEFSENLQVGRLAQLGERLVYTQEVGSSILSPPTTSVARYPSTRPKVIRMRRSYAVLPRARGSLHHDQKLLTSSPGSSG